MATNSIHFTHIDEYHDTVVRNKRAEIKEMAQTCPVCLRPVVPENFDKHNAVHHPDNPVTFVKDTGFDFNALDVETRVVVVQEDKEFNENMEDASTKFTRACRNIKRIHEALRYKRPGFREYYESKPGLSKSTAYRMLSIAEMCPESGQIQADKEALYLLAKPTTTEEAKREALDLAESGEYLSNARVKSIVEKHSVTRPENIARIVVGVERRSEWVNEVEASGYIQPGDEEDARHINDEPEEIDAAIGKRAEHHRQMAINEKLAASYTPPAETPTDEPTEPLFSFEIVGKTEPFTLIIRAVGLTELEVATLQTRLQTPIAKFRKDRATGKINKAELEDPTQELQAS